MSSPRQSRENSTQSNTRVPSASPVRKQSSSSRPSSLPIKKHSNSLPTVKQTPRLADLAADDKEKIALIVQQFTETCRHRDELTEIIKEQESQVHHLIRERWTTTQENTRLAKEVENLRQRINQTEQEASDQISELQTKIKKLCTANRQLATICSDQKEHIKRQEKKEADMETKYGTMVAAMQCLELKLEHSKRSIKKLKNHVDKSRMERCFPAQKTNHETQTDRTHVCCDRCSSDSVSLHNGRPIIQLVDPQGRVVGLPPSGYLPRNPSSGATTTAKSSNLHMCADSRSQPVHAYPPHPTDTQYATFPLVRDILPTLDAHQTSSGVLSQHASIKTSEASSGPLSQNSTEANQTQATQGTQPACYMSMEGLPRQLHQQAPPDNQRRPQPATRHVVYSKSVNSGNGQMHGSIPFPQAASRWTLSEHTHCQVPIANTASESEFSARVNDGLNNGGVGENNSVGVNNGVGGGVLTWAATVMPASPQFNRTPVQPRDTPAPSNRQRPSPPSPQPQPFWQPGPCVQPQPTAPPQPHPFAQLTQPQPDDPIQPVQPQTTSFQPPGTWTDCQACFHSAAPGGQLMLSPQAVEDWMLHKLFFSGRTPCAVSHPNLR